MVFRLSRKLVIIGLSLGMASASLAQDAPQGGLRSLLDDLIGGNDQATTAAPTVPARRVPFGRAEMQMSFAPLVKDTAPAVVNVYASVQPKGVASPFAGDPFFEQFFRRQMPPRAQSALGSGVIVDATGIIVTNNHVIKDADKIKVAMADGREFDSVVLLKDESLDLAVLKISGTEPFPVVPVGDSETLEVGDLVLAIGNPFGVGQTTTSGIVSALARTHVGVNDFGFFIQTDAAINPGNSGGGLIDMGGNLIGINTAIYSRSGGSIGIGFAIPSNIVAAVVAAAKAGHNYFERPYIGATFDRVTPNIAEALGIERPVGALITNVITGGPSDIAGLAPGDVVLTLNGAAVENPDGLGYRLATLQIGTKATAKVLSAGKERDVEISLERAPESVAGEIDIRGESPLSGATIAEMSPRLAQRLGMPSNTTGVTVVNIREATPAAQFGLRQRDIILELNGQKVRSVAQLSAIVGESARWWRFTIERDGQIMQQMLRY